MENIYFLLAKAFEYPHPGQLEQLEAGLTDAGKGGAVSGQSNRAARSRLTAFVKRIGRLSLSEWEELATRTLELSPAAAPYSGFQTWGENYQRGEFMAKVNRAPMPRRASAASTSVRVTSASAWPLVCAPVR